MNLDAEVEALSQERHLIASKRALKRMGIDAEWTPDGTISVLDPDVYDVELAILNDPEYLATVAEELAQMVIDDYLDELVAKGLVVRVLRDDGEIVYEAAPGIEL